VRRSRLRLHGYRSPRPHVRRPGGRPRPHAARRGDRHEPARLVDGDLESDCRRAGGGGGAAVPVSSVSLPDRLVISGFSSTPFRNRTDPVTLRIRVSDTRGRLVQGALVYATAVPFGRVSTPPETATDSNGIVTLTVQGNSRLELRSGTAVQFFLRARKPGDNLLAGVSSRRLVQVRIIPG
jgi:hypothetical protein